MLDFRIKTFLTLCETKSYTNTAKLLDITQPSVTQHIKYLQKRYQCQLFIYEGKTLRLTPEGEYLQRQATAMTQNSTKIIEDLRRISSKQKPLRFGCTKDFGEVLVPSVIGKMMEADEDLEVSMFIENSATLIEMLECGKLDVVLVDKSFAKKEFESFVISKEQYCGWANPAHADSLYGLSLKRMFREKLIVREEGSGTRAILEQILDGRNCDLDDFYATMLCNSPASIKALTAENVGISFGFASCMREEVNSGKLRKICLADFAEEREIVFLNLENSIQVDKFKPFYKKFKQVWAETTAVKGE